MAQQLAVAQTVPIDTVVLRAVDIAAADVLSDGTVVAAAPSTANVYVNGRWWCDLAFAPPGGAFPPATPCVGDAETFVAVPGGGSLFIGGGPNLRINSVTAPRVMQLAWPSGAPTAWRLRPAFDAALPSTITRFAWIADGRLLAAGPLPNGVESAVLVIDPQSGDADDVLVVQGGIRDLDATPDGGALVSGTVSVDVGGTVRRGVLKLVPGSLALDAGFLSGADGAVGAVAVAPDGLIYAARADAVGAIRMLASGAIDATWSVTADATIHAVGVDAQGRPYVAGAFNQVNGAPRRGLARLSAASGAPVDSSWVAELIDGNPTRIEVRDAELLVSGPVTAMSSGQGGVLRYTLTTAQPPAPSDSVRVGGDANFSSPGSDPRIIRRVQPAGDGDVIIVGDFSMTATRVVPGMVRVDRFGNERASWTPPLHGRIVSLAVDPSGVVYLAGRLARSGEAVGVGRTLRLDGVSGAIDPAWEVLHSAADVQSMTVRPPWVYMLGGFTALNGTPAVLASRVSTAAPATVDASYSPAVACCTLLDYRGIFPQVDESSVLLFRPAGTIDFDPPPPPGPPIQPLFRLQPQAGGPASLVRFGIALDSSLAQVNNLLTDGRGQQYITGLIRPAADPTRNGIVRLLPGGDMDPTFVNFTSACRPFGPATVAPDGLLYLLCDESSFVRRVVRLVPDSGQIDLDWLVSDNLADATDLVTAGDRIIVAFGNRNGGPLPIQSFSTAVRPLFAAGFED